MKKLLTDTNFWLPCTPSGHFDFRWNADAKSFPIDTDGKTVKTVAAGVDDEETWRATLMATYDKRTGLRGTITATVRQPGYICKKEGLGFYAVADR